MSPTEMVESMSYQLRPARVGYWLRTAFTDPREAAYCIPRRLACRLLGRHNGTCRGRVDHVRRPL